MVRTYKKKTSYGLHIRDDELRAADHVLCEKRSRKSVVDKDAKLAFNRLRRYDLFQEEIEKEFNC